MLESKKKNFKEAGGTEYIDCYFYGFNLETEKLNKILYNYKITTREYNDTIQLPTENSPCIKKINRTKSSSQGLCDLNEVHESKDRKGRCCNMIFSQLNSFRDLFRQ